MQRLPPLHSPPLPFLFLSSLPLPSPPLPFPPFPLCSLPARRSRYPLFQLEGLGEYTICVILHIKIVYGTTITAASHTCNDSSDYVF